MTRTFSSTTTTSPESLTLTRLGDDNHEDVGQELALSVQQWLDAEWMPLTVHAQVGESCKQSYISSRLSGHDDLMLLMTTVVDDLVQDWHEYDDDIFVNAWDITNYVSDFMIQKMGNDDDEGCECSATIY